MQERFLISCENHMNKLGKNLPACHVIGFNIYTLLLPTSKIHKRTEQREENPHRFALAYGISIGVLQEVIWKARNESRVWLTRVSAWSTLVSSEQQFSTSALGFQSQSSPATHNVRKLQWKSPEKKIVAINWLISIAPEGNLIIVCPAALVLSRCISEGDPSPAAYHRVCFNLHPPLLLLKKGTYLKRIKDRNFPLPHHAVCFCPQKTSTCWTVASPRGETTRGPDEVSWPKD